MQDLVLNDSDSLWQQIHATTSWNKTLLGSTSLAYPRTVPTLAAFKQQVKLVDQLTQKDRVADIWHRYGVVLEQGFGLRTSGMLCMLLALFIRMRAAVCVDIRAVVRMYMRDSFKCNSSCMSGQVRTCCVNPDINSGTEYLYMTDGCQ